MHTAGITIFKLVASQGCPNPDRNSWNVLFRARISFRRQMTNLETEGNARDMILNGVSLKHWMYLLGEIILVHERGPHRSSLYAANHTHFQQTAIQPDSDGRNIDHHRYQRGRFVYCRGSVWQPNQSKDDSMCLCCIIEFGWLTLTAIQCGTTEIHFWDNHSYRLQAHQLAIMSTA